MPKLLEGHKCERWWAKRIPCPFGILEDDGDDDREQDPQVIPLKKPEKIAKPGRDSIFDDFDDIPIPIKIPPKKAVPEGVPGPNPLPGPIPFPQRVPTPIREPNPIPQRPAAIETASSTAELARQQQQAARLRENRTWQQEQSNRVQNESQSLSQNIESVTGIYLPPWTSSRDTGGSGGAVAENSSTAIAETALAASYERRRTSSRPGLNRPVDEGERGVAPKPPPKALPSPGEAWQPVPRRKTRGRKQPTRSQIFTAAGIAAATTGAAEIIRRTRGGGGRPPTGVAGVGKNVRDVITGRPAFGYKFVPRRSRAAKAALRELFRNRRSEN